MFVPLEIKVKELSRYLPGEGPLAQRLILGFKTLLDEAAELLARSARPRPRSREVMILRCFVEKMREQELGES